MLWKMPPELVYGVTSFLDGKALSSLMMETLLMASKPSRSSLHASQPPPPSSASLTMCYIMRRWQEDTVQLLSSLQFPQLALIQFVQESLVTRTNAIQATLLSNNNSHQIICTDTAALLMRQFSEWCLLMDYVLQGPRSSSASSSSSPIQMLWPIGVGVFKMSPVCGGNVPLQTKVVLSCPVWDPAPVRLSRDVWLPHDETTHHFFRGGVGAPTHFSWLPSEGDIDGFLPDQNIAVLQPFDDTNVRSFQATQALARDDDFLSAMGRPDSCLSILPAVDCPIYGSLLEHMMLRSSSSSSRHAWLLDEQRRQHCSDGEEPGSPRMLCFFDSQPNYVLEGESSHKTESNSDVLIEQIIHLMKTLQGAATNGR